MLRGIEVDLTWERIFWCSQSRIVLRVISSLSLIKSPKGIGWHLPGGPGALYLCCWSPLPRIAAKVLNMILWLHTVPKSKCTTGSVTNLTTRYWTSGAEGEILHTGATRWMSLSHTLSSVGKILWTLAWHLDLLQWLEQHLQVRKDVSMELKEEFYFHLEWSYRGCLQVELGTKSRRNLRHISQLVADAVLARFYAHFCASRKLVSCRAHWSLVNCIALPNFSVEAGWF